jgi:hypothetical protein
MAEFLTRNLKMAISATPESSYNTIKVGAADTYLGMLTTGRAFYVPDKEKVDDTGKIGTGREFPTEQRSTYVTVPSLEITEELNVDMAALLLRRAMGGADVVSAVTTTRATPGNPSVAIAPASTINDHTWGLDLVNRQLPSSSMLWAIPNSGADYIWGGVVVESYAISQTNSDVPTITVGLVGSGMFKRLSRLTANGQAVVNGTNPYTGPYPNTPAAPALYPPIFPMPTAQRYMIGAESELLFTPTAGVEYSVTGSGQRMKAFSATLTNNHRTDDRRPGDPRVESAQPRAGHYVNRMNHGDRTIGGDMTVMLDETLSEFYNAYNDTVLESFTYRAKGAYLGATAPSTESNAQSEFEIIFPKAYLRGVAGTDDAGDAVLTMSIFPVDNGTTGPMIARVRNNSATAIN